MTQAAGDLLFEILQELSAGRIFYTLAQTQDDAVTVQAVVPGERWEIDIHRDGTLEFEVFKSGGHLCNLEELREAIQKFADYE